MFATLDIEQEMIILYTNIISKVNHFGKKKIMFISARQGEGTSTIAQEFAKVASLTFGNSVILVDIDLNHLESSQIFDIDQSDLGNSTTDDHSHSAISQMSPHAPFAQIQPIIPLLPSSHMFSFYEVEHTLSEVGKAYDLVVVDSPPVKLSANGLALAARVDGVVIVVEADSTRGPIVKRLVDNITQAGGNILGMVLNKRRNYIPSTIYKRL